jgi:ATP-dependent DNA helicase RecQ
MPHHQVDAPRGESARQPLAVLEAVFGFKAFRPGQDEVIEAVLRGEDVLAVMPTGSGKSLCYQLPALIRPGLTVVVSPLIALMQDQVGQLVANGVAAASLNSTADAAENRRVVEAIRTGGLKLLYVAPERLNRPDTLADLRNARVDLLAIDEAHCVSQWGHDFRPEYLTLGQVRERLGGVQTIALTATADTPTREDIAGKLFNASPRTFVRSFDRPNLYLAMQPKANSRRQLLSFLAARREQSGIVYCASRKRTEAIAAQLVGEGFRALPYHAGLEPSVRSANQSTFLRQDGVVMVATVAFGMGIDKPDVRFVCHADLPKNVESYYQEIGRAGRDGLPADTLTLYGFDDIRIRRSQIEDSELPEERKRIEVHRFNALLALCEAPRCRRQTLLAYFGEASEPCDGCDLCLQKLSVFDATIDAQKAMSAILRTGECFGTEHLVALLVGEATDAIRRYGHDRLKTFAVGKNRPAGEWRSIFRQLYAAGVINLDIVRHGRWTVTDYGRRVLSGDVRISLREDVLSGAKAGRARTAAAKPLAESEADPALLAALKALRTELAAAQQVPAYVVFADRTLIEMAARRPTTLAALREVHGVGDEKLKRYGAAFLAAIAGHPGSAG